MRYGGQPALQRRARLGPDDGRHGRDGRLDHGGRRAQERRRRLRHGHAPSDLAGAPHPRERAALLLRGRRRHGARAGARHALLRPGGADHGHAAQAAREPHRRHRRRRRPGSPGPHRRRDVHRRHGGQAAGARGRLGPRWLRHLRGEHVRRRLVHGRRRGHHPRRAGAPDGRHPQGGRRPDARLPGGRGRAGGRRAGRRRAHLHRLEGPARLGPLDAAHAVGVMSPGHDAPALAF